MSRESTSPCGDRGSACDVKDKFEILDIDSAIFGDETQILDNHVNSATSVCQTCLPVEIYTVILIHPLDTVRGLRRTEIEAFGTLGCCKRTRMVRLAQNRPGGSLPLSLIRSGQNVGDGQNPISTGVRAKTWIF
jgi:hypothetical protein